MKQRIKGLFAIVIAVAVLMSFTVVAYARNEDGTPERGNLRYDLGSNWVSGKTIYPGDILYGMCSGGYFVQVDADNEIIPGGTGSVYNDKGVEQDIKCYSAYEELSVPNNAEGYDGYTLKVDVYKDKSNVSYRADDTYPINQVYFEPIEIKYTIYYDANAEYCVGSIEPLEVGYHTTKALSDGTGLSREGYKLKSWALVSDKDGNIQNEPIAELELGSSAAGLSNKNGADVFLKAIWEEKNCTISYDANGGNGNIEDQTELFNKEAVLSDGMEFDRDGYTLVEWNTQDDGTGEVFSLGGKMTVKNDVTLYAVWEKEEDTPPDGDDNVIEPDNPVDTDNSAISPRVPKTGEEANVMMIIILFICSFVVAVAIFLVIYKVNVGGKYSK